VKRWSFSTAPELKLRESRDDDSALRRQSSITRSSPLDMIKVLLANKKEILTIDVLRPPPGCPIRN